mgnify:CR=1 FL=1
MGCDIRRPCQATVVVVRLGDACEHTAHADAVAAHPYRHRLAVLVAHLTEEDFKAHPELVQGYIGPMAFGPQNDGDDALRYLSSSPRPLRRRR